jgi:hypothetical protein
MSEVVSPHEQALLRITAGPKRWKRVGSILKADPRFLAERWLEELAKRRCVWCWNLLDPEVDGSVYDFNCKYLARKWSSLRFNCNRQAKRILSVKMVRWSCWGILNPELRAAFELQPGKQKCYVDNKQ